jgi:putative FmdB family regulatory protein
VPTYEYACTVCDHTFEQVQSFSDASLTTCPDCGGALRKIYGAVGVVFKGSGFYRTDSRKAESASAPSSAGKADAKSEGKSEGKADGKSDSTTPAKKDPSGTPSSTPTPAAPATPAKGPSTKTKSSTGGSSTS